MNATKTALGNEQKYRRPFRYLRVSLYYLNFGQMNVLSSEKNLSAQIMPKN